VPACFGYESRIRDHWTVDPDIEWFAAQQASDSRDWRRRASCKLQQRLDQTRLKKKQSPTRPKSASVTNEHDFLFIIGTTVCQKNTWNILRICIRTHNQNLRWIDREVGEIFKVGER